MNGEHEADAIFTAERIAPVTVARRRKLPLRWAVTIGYTVAAFTAILVAFLQPRAPQMIDLDVYRVGASAVFHDIDPYHVAGPFGLPFTYPIFAALVFIPFALLPELAARAAITVVSFVALIVICHVSLRQLAPRFSHRQAALISLPAAVLAVFAHPMLATLSFGQINLILAAMVLADVFLVTGPARGVLVGLAAGIKLTPGLFLVYYLVTGQRREARTAALTAGLTVLAGFATQPHAAWAYWTRYLLDPGRDGGVTYAENQSILAVTARLMRTTQPPSWLTWALTAVVVVGAAAIARRANRAGDELTAVSVIAAAALLASPISWTHHWVWFLPATAAVAAWCHRAGGRWRWWLLAAAVCVFWTGPMQFMPQTNLRELAQTPAQQVVTNSFAVLAVVFLGWAGYTVGNVSRLFGRAPGNRGAGAAADGRRDDCSEVGTTMTMTTNADEQYERGLEALRQADGGAGQRLLDALGDISPELSYRSVAWSYGDLYVRPELARRDRELLTLGILTGLGGADSQLEVHVNGALNAGLTATEIVEALLQSVVYCGVPRAVNATLVAKKVFAERNLLPVRPDGAG